MLGDILANGFVAAAAAAAAAAATFPLFVDELDEEPESET